jgi:hypothetical protein
VRADFDDLVLYVCYLEGVGMHDAGMWKQMHIMLESNVKSTLKGIQKQYVGVEEEGG